MEIFIPKLPSYNIVQLAKVINPDAEIEYIGIRPGEKIHECMINTHESHNTLNCKNYFIILQDKESDPTNLIYISVAILIVALATVIIRFRNSKYLKIDKSKSNEL